MSAQIHELTGRMLLETEATDEARHHLATAVALDPGRAQVIDMDLARVDALLGDWPSATARMQRLLADPDKPIAQLGAIVETRLAGWRGDREAVIAASTRFLPRLDNDGPGILLGFIRESIRANHVDLENWRGLSTRFAAPGHPKRPQVFSFQLLAEVTVTLGSAELAVEVLEQAQRAGLIDVLWLDRCPLFATIREAPGFIAIRERVAAQARRVHAAIRGS